MKKISFALLLIVLFLTGHSQGSQEKTGYTFSGLLSFDQYYLTEQVGTAPAKEFRSASRLPDDFTLGYHLGFINKKKNWHQSALGFSYFPAFVRTYSQSSEDGINWTDLVTPKSVNMELYQVDLSKTFKINLFLHRFYLTFGGGASGGVVRLPAFTASGEDLFLFSGQLWPFGGVELMLFKGLGLFAEMRYHVGLSESVSTISDGINSQWQYRFGQQEIRAGINLYFSK